MQNQKKRGSTRMLLLSGLMAAAIAVLAQLSIPMPVGVPVTLQTLAVAVTGFLLGPALAPAATGVYLLLGALGLPVFAGFAGGVGVLVGYTGGFLWGFPLLAFFCGLGTGRRLLSRVLLGTAGLVLCHAVGVLWFAFASGRGIPEAFLLVSLPYLLKDAVSLAAAGLFASLLRRRIKI